MPTWAGQGKEGPLEWPCLFPLPVSPRMEKEPLKELLLSLKMLFISFFITGTYVLTFANMNQFTFMQRKAENTAHFFAKHNKKTPPNPHTSQWHQFGKTVTLKHVTVSTLSSVNKASCVHPVPPQSGSMASSTAMCIRWSRTQGKVLSPALADHQA